MSLGDFFWNGKKEKIDFGKFSLGSRQPKEI